MKRNKLSFFLAIFFCNTVIAQQQQIPTPQWRPLYHFTPAKNWTNDPNGLVFLNGEYHLYNQQNPFENKWGHMSWGHATSTDLVHWKYLPVAIPEKINGADTTWIFSGCNVLDKNNTSGFCTTPGGCLVAVYTAHKPNLKNESQYIAYSNDGGMTYTNYEKNPVIDLNKKDFRDPNVFWHAPTKKWIMVVALPHEHKVQFYGAPNLKKWQLLSEFGNQGFTGAAWECPFLLQLPVQGKPNTKKWILVNSAAGPVKGTFMQYYTGEFDGIKFKNDNEPNTILPVDEGDCFYAAIPWNNLPENKNTFIGWMVPAPQETSPWRGQMSIPRELSLRQTPEGIRLVQQPSTLIKNKLAEFSGNKIISINNLKLYNNEVIIGKETKLASNTYWLKAELVVAEGTSAGFKVAQEKDVQNNTLTETVIGYDAAKKQVWVDRSRSGEGKLKPDKLMQRFAVKTTGGKIKFEILLDKSSLEVFVNDGEKVLTTLIFPNANADALSAFATGGRASITNLTIWDLATINSANQ